jgi:hypothetical protein
MLSILVQASRMRNSRISLFPCMRKVLSNFAFDSSSGPRSVQMTSTKINTSSPRSFQRLVAPLTWDYFSNSVKMLSCLANYLDRKFTTLPQGCDVDGFLNLLLVAVQSQSLVVSIPVLVAWTRLLTNRSIGPRSANSHLIGPLLELCSARQIRYENLPEDTQDPTYLYLLEDTDTVPERHAFLGNYRRYSSQIIETIVQLKLSEAVYHILGQTENVLQHLYDDQPALDGVFPGSISLPPLIC